MGKRKIGEIYNKPIVEGDKNLVTKNEVHKDSFDTNTSNIEYLDISNLEGTQRTAMINLSYISRAESSSVALGLQIKPSMLLSVMGAADKINAVAISSSIHMTKHDSSLEEKQEIMDFVEAVRATGWEDFTIEKYNSIPRITEEEFYSL